jgi:hypothetical protein
MTDSDFTDDFTVIRATETVTSGGIAVRSGTNFVVTGIIQPASGEDLVQLPELERANSAIVVYCGLRLMTAAAGQAPDTVIWNDQRWLVSHVDPFGNWGSGYVRCICTLEDVVTTEGVDV